MTASPLAYTGPHPELFFQLPVEQQSELVKVFAKLAALPDGLLVTVGNLKGGVSKTTTVIYLALMLGLSGDPVLVVDGDATNRSALLWQAATAEWPSNVRVVSWAGEDGTGRRISGQEMARRVLEQRGRFRHILIDTGPQMREYLAAALRVTNDFIVCTSPYPLDIIQVPASVALAAEVEAGKGQDVYVTVLLSKAKKNTNSLKEAQKSLETDEIAYFTQPITTLESYALSFGVVPNDFMEYVPVLRQLVEGQEAEEAA